MEWTDVSLEPRCTGNFVFFDGVVLRLIPVYGLETWSETVERFKFKHYIQLPELPQPKCPHRRKTITIIIEDEQEIEYKTLCNDCGERMEED